MSDLPATVPAMTDPRDYTPVTLQAVVKFDRYTGNGCEVCPSPATHRLFALVTTRYAVTVAYLCTVHTVQVIDGEPIEPGLI